MSAPSLAGANYANPRDICGVPKPYSGTLKNVLSLSSNRVGDIRISSPEVLVPDHEGPHSGTAVSAQPKVRTQTCMNLCEVDLVIVKLGVS